MTPPIESSDLDHLYALTAELNHWESFPTGQRNWPAVHEHGWAVAVLLERFGIDPEPLLAMLQFGDEHRAADALLLIRRLVVKVEVAATAPDQAQWGTAQHGEEAARHSPDFRSVVWFGDEYSFTGNQAACVKVLWEAWKNGTPDVSDATLLEAAGIETKRLDHVFKQGRHPAWGVVIVAGATKGTHRLHAPGKRTAK